VYNPAEPRVPAGSGRRSVSSHSINEEI
jgi:hypothetical protein